MSSIFKILLIIGFSLSTSFYAADAEPAPATDVTPQTNGLSNAMVTNDVGYYNLTPDFTTNIAGASPSGKLHYLRVRVIVMLRSTADLEDVKKRDAIMRDAILSIFGSKTYEEVSSPEGREAIRSECRERVTKLIDNSIGHPVIQDLLFTNYLYQ